MIAQLEREMQPLLAKADQADATPLQDGLTIPAEITRRQARQPPPATTPEPTATDQYNFTDPESRIMKAGSGQHFEQSDNAPAAVEVESRLIVGARVSPSPNDQQELAPTLASVPAEAGPGAAVLVDSGFFSEPAGRPVEQTPEDAATGTTVWAAVEKTGHHRSVSDLEAHPEPAPLPPEASATAVMRHRLQTTAGRGAGTI